MGISKWQEEVGWMCLVVTVTGEGVSNTWYPGTRDAKHLAMLRVVLGNVTATHRGTRAGRLMLLSHGFR